MMLDIIGCGDCRMASKKGRKREGGVAKVLTVLSAVELIHGSGEYAHRLRLVHTLRA